MSKAPRRTSHGLSNTSGSSSQTSDGTSSKSADKAPGVSMRSVKQTPEWPELDGLMEELCPLIKPDGYTPPLPEWAKQPLHDAARAVIRHPEQFAVAVAWLEQRFGESAYQKQWQVEGWKRHKHEMILDARHDLKESVLDDRPQHQARLEEYLTRTEKQWLQAYQPTAPLRRFEDALNRVIEGGFLQIPDVGERATRRRVIVLLAALLVLPGSRDDLGEFGKLAWHGPPTYQGLGVKHDEHGQTIEDHPPVPVRRDVLFFQGIEGCPLEPSHVVTRGRLQDLVSMLDAAMTEIQGTPTLAEGSRDVSEKANRPAEPERRRHDKLANIAEAMSLVQREPHLSNSEIARRVGVHPSTLSRSHIYKTAASLAKCSNRTPSKGTKSADGVVESDDDGASDSNDLKGSNIDDHIDRELQRNMQR